VGSEADRLAGRLQSAAKPLPFLHEIHWDIIREEQPRWLKFMKGQLDITSIPRDSFSDVIAADGGLRKPYLEKGVRLHKELSLTTWWLEFNMKDPLVGKNVNLRKALAFAFDRVRALEILYNNRGVLASGPISPTYEGGQEAEKFPYSFDLEKAKEHLKLAGFAEGKGLPELVFDLRGSNSTQRQLGELLANNFLKIGVKLKLSGNSFQEALDKAKNSKFQIMLGGWHADYPDPENYLQLFVGSNQAPGPNTANFVSAEYDRLFKEMRVMSASKKRSEKIATMVAILNQELPVVFFFHAMDYFVVQGWVKNYRPHQLLYGTGRYFDLDLGNREKTLSEKY
jgi:oligopeptide transport system substrate-binding protein